MAEYPFKDGFVPILVREGIIEEEKNENEFYFRGNDKKVFQQLLDEINQTTGSYKYYYLTQFDIMYYKAGCSSILLKYVDQFESEHIRMLLMRKIVYDKRKNKVKVKDVDRLVMDFYHHFRTSEYYVLPPGQGCPDYIYISYDNNLKRVLTRKIVPEIIELLKSLREIYILPLTAIAIAKKWAPEELGKIMSNHLINKNVTNADVGIPGEGDYKPTLERIVRQTRCNAIMCLEYYPSEENVQIIMEYADHPDERLAKFARESAEKMRKKLQEMQA